MSFVCFHDQAKLDDAYKNAQAFHDDLQAFITWLTTAEKNLNAAKPPSTVLDNINKQIADHKVGIHDLGNVSLYNLWEVRLSLTI